MREIFKYVARVIGFAVCKFIVASVVLKLWNNEKTWLIESILCAMANFSANIIFYIREALLQNENEEAEIIEFVTRKEIQNKTDWKTTILETVFIIATFYFVLVFLIGVLFGVKNWKDITWSPTIFFITTYIECMYRNGEIEL